MATKEEHDAKVFTSVERSNLSYWFIVILLLAAFATATALLYSSTLVTLKEGGESNLPGNSALVTSLAGLVVIFCLYMLQRQAELARLRAKLLNQRVKMETLRAQLEELSSLFDVGTAINMRLKLDGIIKIIVRRLPNCLAADRASIMMIDQATGTLECKAAWGFGSNLAAHRKSPVGDGIAGWVAANGRPLLLNGHELGRFSQFAKMETEISSAMCVPIKLKQLTIGVLNVTRIRSKERFGRQQLRLLVCFAEHIAGAIRKAHLYEEMNSTKGQLEQDNRELVSLNQLKEVFLATLSHELKTPLTCIVSFSEILDEQGSKLADGDRQRFVSIVHEQAEKMLDLTEQIMDLSRLQKGTLELNLKETDVNEVVRSTYIAHVQTASSKQIELRTELAHGLRPILADPTKLRQIVLNLVGNAIKFTEEGGRIVVATRSSGDKVEVSVTDTGVGLDSEEISRIFGLFTQVARTGQSQSGLGLGLYLVKKFVELHKGEVKVESEKGRGTTFRVLLPARPTASAEEQPAEAEAPVATEELSAVQG
jgi:signal transduction histidine kinase